MELPAERAGEHRLAVGLTALESALKRAEQWQSRQKESGGRSRA